MHTAWNPQLASSGYHSCCALVHPHRRKLRILAVNLLILLLVFTSLVLMRVEFFRRHVLGDPILSTSSTMDMKSLAPNTLETGPLEVHASFRSPREALIASVARHRAID